jgi:hypothetical protein
MMTEESFKNKQTRDNASAKFVQATDLLLATFFAAIEKLKPET